VGDKATLLLPMPRRLRRLAALRMLYDDPWLFLTVAFCGANTLDTSVFEEACFFFMLRS
jgi:hypothetical protein